MGEVESDIWSKAKCESFRSEFLAFLGVCRIHSKETGGFSILGENIFGSQIRMLDAIFDGLEHGIHDFKFLKSRQLGASTFARAFAIFWLGVHDGLQGALVLDSDGNKEAARREIETMIENLPPSIKFPRVKSQNRYSLTLDNGSKLHFFSAGTRKGRTGGGLGRSTGLNFVIASEMCFAPGTPVIVGDGKIKHIENVEIGDRIITHTGQMSSVSATKKIRNDKPMLKLQPWLADPIICTENHKIVTQRGKVEAKDLTLSDYMVMPIRKITSEISGDNLPQTPKRPQNGGGTGAASGSRIEYTEELGFAIGYYLAEGSLTFSGRGGDYGKNACGIIFTRHRKEAAYADRALAALLPFTSGTRATKDNNKSLTTTEHVYCAPLAKWVRSKFVDRQDKVIPDEVFLWGKPFCRGLIAGLVSGDGSKTNDQRVSLTTTRASLATQARDIVASLGYGWGGIHHKDGGLIHGRNCKEAWIVDWSGVGAHALLPLMGITPRKVKDHRSQRYVMTPDAVLFRLRSIEAAPDCAEVYDITVDHDDHTFRTPSMSVSNCNWENEAGLEALKPALSKTFPNRLYIWESTARGPNLWQSMWQDAENDDLTQRTEFLGWWSRDDQRLKEGTPIYLKYASEPPTEKEEGRIKAVKDQYGVNISMEQLAWIRSVYDPSQLLEEDESEDPLKTQEQPWTAEEAFQITGSTFFSAQKLSEAMQKTSSGDFQSYKFYHGTDFFQTRIERARSLREVQLKVWEDPVPNAMYIISADPAYGHDPRNNNSAIQVIRCYADRLEQVAEFADAETPTSQFAWVIAALCGWYGVGTGGAYKNQIEVIIEINGPGESVFKAFKEVKELVNSPHMRKEVSERGLKNIFQNVRNYLYSRTDSYTQSMAQMWKTSGQLKEASLERLRDFIYQEVLVVRSLALLQEMQRVVRDGETIGAPGMQRDDRTIAMSMATRSWEDNVRRKLMAEGRTKQRDDESRKITPADKFAIFNKHQIESFLQRKKMTRINDLRQQSYRSWRYK